MSTYLHPIYRHPAAANSPHLLSPEQFRLEDLMELVGDDVKRQVSVLSGEDDCPFLLFMANEETIAVTEFGSLIETRGKDEVVLSLIPDMCREFDAHGVVTISPSWIAPDDPLITAGIITPSQHPERQELISVVGMDRDGNQDLRNMVVERLDGAVSVSDLPDPVPGVKQIGGTFGVGLHLAMGLDPSEVIAMTDAADPRRDTRPPRRPAGSKTHAKRKRKAGKAARKRNRN